MARAVEQTAFNWERLPPAVLWYLVGLIAADGCLSGDGRHIDITAKDYTYLMRLKTIAAIPQRITVKHNGSGQCAHRIQIGSARFHRFLRSVGLTPRKSLTLGALQVPTEFFDHFLRGVIDGDGCLRRWRHATNGREQWSLRIVSGSLEFLQWLAATSRSCLGAIGKVYAPEPRKAGVLKFGKLAARQICQRVYIESQGAMCLARKFELAQSCLAAKRGWKRSRTVIARVAK